MSAFPPVIWRTSDGKKAKRINRPQTVRQHQRNYLRLQHHLHRNLHRFVTKQLLKNTKNDFANGKKVKRTNHRRAKRTRRHNIAWIPLLPLPHAGGQSAITLETTIHIEGRDNPNCIVKKLSKICELVLVVLSDMYTPLKLLIGTLLQLLFWELTYTNPQQQSLPFADMI